MERTQEQIERFKDRLIPIREAARRAGCRYGRVVEWIEKRKLRAFRLGGGKVRKRLAVLPEELDRAIADDMQYIPGDTRPRSRGTMRELNPRVTC